MPKTSTKTKPKSKAQQARDLKSGVIQSFSAVKASEQTVYLDQVDKDTKGQAGPGRPTKYSKRVAALICDQIAAGASLRTVCRDENLPSRFTVFIWLGDGKHEEFVNQYARACEERTEAMAEDILDIADDGTNDYMEIKDADGHYTGNYKVNGDAIQRSKLRVEARLQLMAKLKPKKYGNKVDITSNGEGLPAPLIYIPRELPYTAVKQQERGIIDATSTDEPAATTEGQTS